MRAVDPSLRGSNNLEAGTRIYGALRSEGRWGSQQRAGTMRESGGRGSWWIKEYDPLEDKFDRAGSLLFLGRKAVGLQGYDLTDLGGPSNRVAQAYCPPGSYCEHGVSRLCPAGKYGFSFGLSSPNCDGDCGPGHFCPIGSIRRRQLRCPAGRWSGGGSGDALCSGECEAGWYCPEASTSAREKECGGETFFCPSSSPMPLNVTNGFFATGGKTVRTRTGQSECKDWVRSSGSTAHQDDGGADHDESSSSSSLAYFTPPAHAAIVGKCPETTMPLSGSAHLGYPRYDGFVGAKEYKRDVNEQGVALGTNPDYSGDYARANDEP